MILKNTLTLRIANINFEFVLQMGTHFGCDRRVSRWQLRYQTKTQTSQLQMLCFWNWYLIDIHMCTFQIINATLGERLEYSRAGQPDLFSMKLSLACWSSDLAVCHEMRNRMPRIPSFSRLTCFAELCSWDLIHYYLILFWLKDVLI